MFEPYNFVRNLEYMGKGMLAHFCRNDYHLSSGRSDAENWA